MNTSSDQISVLLTGASSQLGVFLIPRLLDAGFRVLSLSRQVAESAPLGAENPLWVHPETLLNCRGDEWVEVLGQVKMFVSCGPLDVANAAISACPEMVRSVIFSTSSVFTKVRSPEHEESEQIAAMLGHEKALKALCQKRGLPLMILRPTLIYGCGLDRNISLLASWIQRYRCLPLAGAAKGLRQPVHADDLAQVAVAALTIEKPLTLDSPACGGSTLSYRQMVGLVFDGLGLPRRMVSVPTPVLVAITGILASLRVLRGVNREMIRRQNADQVFDDSALKLALNFKPRQFKPTTADLEIPPSARQYQLREQPGSE